MFFPCNSRKDEDAAGIGEVTEKIEELVLASQTLPDITAAIRELTNLAATQRVILTPSQLQTIKQGFCCVICMSEYTIDSHCPTCTFILNPFLSRIVIFQIRINYYIF